MGNWIKNIIKKQDETEKNISKKEQLNKRKEYFIVDIILTIALLSFIFIITIISIINYSGYLGTILALISLIITFCFEGYEWIYLFKKEQKNKHTLMPLFLSMTGVVILSMIIGIFKKITNEKWNNLICSLVLLLYILSLLLRQLVIDYRKTKI